MKKLYTLTLLLILCSTVTMAQKISVKGLVWDQDENDALAGVSASLLTTGDSTLTASVVSDVNGNFTLTGLKAGKYILRLKYVGFNTFYKDITLTKGNKDVNLGTLNMTVNAKMLKEAEVTAKLAQVEMKEDTFVYNADAYRLPEGAALEELVRKLPGAEVGDDGTIKINGKTVSRIMVEGKEFFDNDTKMAMKNLTSKMIKKIKAYDKKSDYSRITGIDDGEEETVLDLTVQKGMREGWLINADLAGGTKDRYSMRANISRFDDHFQFSVMGSRNNVNDNGYPGGGGRGWGGGGGGITTSNMAGVNFAWDNGKPEYTAGLLEIGGNLRWNSSKSTSDSRSNSETFLSDSYSTFSNSQSHSVRHSANLNANFRLEWMPDSLTNLTFRPRFSHSQGDSFSRSLSATFNQDPYEVGGMTDPLKEFADLVDTDSIRVNSNDRISFSDSKSNNGGASMQLNRQLNKPGRNITLNLEGNYSKSENNSYSRSMVKYYQSTAAQSATATYQDAFSPSKNYNYQARLSYTEPIFTGANLQFSYQAQHRFQDSRRTLMVYEDLADSLLAYGLSEISAYNLYTGNYNGVDLQNYGIDLTQLTQDMENSQYATYKEFNQNATVMLRWNTTFENEQKLRFNVGLSFQPQKTHMDYAKASIDTTITRKTNNWSPRVDIRWTISNTSQLRLRYNGNMSQPSMTNLIEVMDSSDPLNISTGNAGLKSSWSDRFTAFYNGYNVEKQRGWAFNFNGNINRRSISSATIYDTESGARYTRPLNIDGNWNTGVFAMFNTAMGEKKMWNISTQTNVNYSNSVGYLSSNLDDNARALIGGEDWMNSLFTYMNSNNLINKRTTKTTNVSENLRLNVRNDFGESGSYEVGVNSGFNFQHARNDVQATGNLDTWTYNYGGYFNLNLPWNMSISSDISEQSRRGYDDESMNTNELVWNAQISQNFRNWLKGHDLTLSVEAYDILGQRSNISRAISATMRSDTWSNAINSYVMVHLMYRLNLLGDKEARGMMGPGGFPMGGRGGRGGFGGPGRM